MNQSLSVSNLSCQFLARIRPYDRGERERERERETFVILIGFADAPILGKLIGSNCKACDGYTSYFFRVFPKQKKNFSEAKLVIHESAYVETWLISCQSLHHSCSVLPLNTVRELDRLTAIYAQRRTTQTGVWGLFCRWTGKGENTGWKSLRGRRISHICTEEISLDTSCVQNRGDFTCPFFLWEEMLFVKGKRWRFQISDIFLLELWTDGKKSPHINSILCV